MDEKSISLKDTIKQIGEKMISENAAMYIRTAKAINNGSRKDAADAIITLNMITAAAQIDLEKVWDNQTDTLTAIKLNGREFSLNDYPDYENRLYDQDGDLWGVTLDTNDNVMGVELYRNGTADSCSIKSHLMAANGWREDTRFLLNDVELHQRKKILDNLETTGTLIAIRPIYTNRIILEYADMSDTSRAIMDLPDYGADLIPLDNKLERDKTSGMITEKPEEGA